MTDTANAPERIWAIAVEDDQGWFVEVISEDAADPAIDLEYVLATHPERRCVMTSCPYTPPAWQSKPLADGRTVEKISKEDV